MSYLVDERRHPDGWLTELNIIHLDGRLASKCFPHFRPQHRAQAEELAKALPELPDGYMLQWIAEDTRTGRAPGWSVDSTHPKLAHWESSGHATVTEAIAAVSDHMPKPAA
ncbi:hypothetical protein ACQSSU_23940 [Micromonospora echinospora]